MSHYQGRTPSPSHKNGKESKPTEPVRTLFVRGLPTDVKSREVYNLFRPYKGFQSSSISYPGEQKLPVSFASFSDHQSALAAMQDLQGLRFDPESHSRLHIELAKSNSKSKKRNVPYTKEREYTSETSSPMEYIEESESRENSDNENSSDMNDETVRSIFNYLYTDQEDFSPLTNTHTMKSQSSSTLYTQRTNTPCSTIFLGNFHACTRTKLESILQSYEGFVRLKVSQKDNSIMCWADYSNVQYSTHALQSIPALSFTPTPGKELRIEYARNPMGTPKKSHSHSNSVM